MNHPSNPLVEWIAHWLDTGQEFRLESIRGTGPFVIHVSEVMINKELLPDCLLMDPRVGWGGSSNEWSGVKALFVERQLPICEAYSRAGSPEDSLEMFRTCVHGQVPELTRHVRKFLKRPGEAVLRSTGDYLEQAKRYAFLNRVLRCPLVTPEFAPLLHEVCDQAATGRKHYAVYMEAFEFVEKIVKGYADLGYDPGPLGLDDLGTWNGYARLRARQIANKLQGKRPDAK